MSRSSTVSTRAIIACTSGDETNASVNSRIPARRRNAMADEPVVARREPARSELRGDDAVLGCAARMQRLGHRSEVHTNASAHAGRDAERVRGGARRQLQQLRGARGGAERSNGPGAVKA